MPELARFFGIIVRMYAEPLAPHHRPHFHAYYQEFVGVYSLDPVEMIGGSLPVRQRRLVEAWAELHEAKNWRRIGGCCSRDAVRGRSRRFNEEPMSHGIYRVESFTIVAPYTLSVWFDDGTARRIDFAPHLQGEVFGPLRDLRLFGQVKLDQEVRTLVWPNGADFDPETLHDWPSEAREVSAAVEDWGKRQETVG